MRYCVQKKEHPISYSEGEFLWKLTHGDPCASVGGR
jgi:hypothetical protein